jgi:16S rRNA (uracil1498-N3)-methyltransferase
MHLFYLPTITNDLLELSEEESKHAIRVLRLKKGDSIDLVDGKGTHAKAIIVDDNPKKCVLSSVSQKLHTIEESTGRNYHLHILIAPTKNSERMEWFIEKAIEIGVDEITFIETTNSERAKVNMDRCAKIAISAMKQSKQWFLPTIHSVVKLNSWLKDNQTEGQHNYIAWCESEQTELLSQKLKQPKVDKQYITIIIGPEGDFTPAEIEAAQQAQFKPVSMGKSILRTETAAIYACASVKTIFG